MSARDRGKATTPVNGTPRPGDPPKHQAAFDLTDGLGPQPHYDDRSAYAHNHERVAEHVRPLERLTTDNSVELPDLGLSL